MNWPVKILNNQDNDRLTSDIRSADTKEYNCQEEAQDTQANCCMMQIRATY